MRIDPKSIAYTFASRSGMAFFHRVFFRNHPSILMYHSVADAPAPFFDPIVLDRRSFQEQMRYLKKNFEVIHLSSLPERMAQPAVDKPLAVVTFDDGYQNNFDVAFPVLREEGVPATVFLTTGLIDTGSTIWTCRLNDAVANTGALTLEWKGTVYPLDGAEAKYKTLAAVKKQLKRLGHAENVKAVKDLLSRLGADPNKTFGPGSQYRMLDSASIRTMHASGLVEFGGHTSTHAILSGLPPGAQEKEIRDSVDAVSKLCGSRCSMFAYPNGSRDDYNEDSIRILKALGVKIAVTTVDGCNDRSTPLLELKRYDVAAGTSKAQFMALTHHLRTLMRKWSMRAPSNKNICE